MAVHHGELSVLRMLQQNRAFKYRPGVADAAAASGNTELLDWLKEEEGVKCSLLVLWLTVLYTHPTTS